MGKNTIVTDNHVKTEIQAYSPYNPNQRVKGSFFGKLFKGLGAIAAPVSFASSLFFPPAAIAGYGFNAMYTMGSRADYKAKLRNLDREGQLARPIPVGYPGIGYAEPTRVTPVSRGTGYRGASYQDQSSAPSPYQSEVMRILTLKQDSISQAVKNP